MPRTKIVCEKIFDILQATYPNAQCELFYLNDFQLLLAVLLSAQTTDKAVNKALKPLLEKEGAQWGAEDLIRLGETRFLDVIKAIGLAPTKAKNALGMARKIVEKHQGKVPLNREQLEDLPGVGRKTANVILNILAQEPTIAVDTHVFRLAKRMGMAAQAATRDEVEAALLKQVPKRHLLKAHHLLIFHGRYHCTARNPGCETCPISQYCSKQAMGSSALRNAE